MLLAGIVELKHRQVNGYYLHLLGRSSNPNRKVALQDDSVQLDMLLDRPGKPKRKARKLMPTMLPPDRAHGADAVGGVGGVLALADAEPEAEEGDPSPDEDDRLGDHEQLCSKVDASQGHWWGRFRFTAVRRKILRGKNKGDMVTQWQISCPYHQDVGDASGTICTRTLQYQGQEGARLASLQLRAWAIAGRHCDSRGVKGQRPHKHHRISKHAKPDPDELEQALQDGLVAPEWIVPMVHDDDDGSSGTFSSSSSTSSSESSS